MYSVAPPTLRTGIRVLSKTTLLILLPSKDILTSNLPFYHRIFWTTQLLDKTSFHKIEHEHGRQRTRRSKLRRVCIYLPSYLPPGHGFHELLILFLTEAISRPRNPTSPAWAKSRTLRLAGQGKPKKASVPLGTLPLPLSSSSYPSFLPLIPQPMSNTRVSS